MGAELKGLTVLFLGDEAASATSRHRAEALRRLGATVTHLNPANALPRRWARLQIALHYRTGYRLLQPSVLGWLQRALLPLGQFDLCWVEGGELLGRPALELLRQRCGKLALFNHDDPTGPRDGQRFATLRASLSLYDVCAVVRRENVEEFQALRAKHVVSVWRSYDEVAHAPLVPDEQVPTPLKSDVAFIGRRFNGEQRDRFLCDLLESGISLAIWGDNWQTSKLWPRLEPHWRGPSLGGREYVHAIAGAKVCIGLLSKGNRDLHTTRSLEIPAAGGLLCAERTADHEALYVDGEEAVFWSSAAECAARCDVLLSDDPLRERIRQAGMQRVRRNRVGNEDLCRQLLREAGVSTGPTDYLRKIGCERSVLSFRSG